MVGRRAKRLLLEGFEQLDQEQQDAIELAARHFEGVEIEDRILNLLVYIEKVEEGPKILRRDMLKAMGLGAVAAASAGLPTDTQADKVARKLVFETLRGRKPGPTAKKGRVGYRSTKDFGRLKDLKKRVKSPEQAKFAWRKKIMKALIHYRKFQND